MLFLQVPVAAPPACPSSKPQRKVSSLEDFPDPSDLQTLLLCDCKISVRLCDSRFHYPSVSSAAPGQGSECSLCLCCTGCPDRCHSVYIFHKLRVRGWVSAPTFLCSSTGGLMGAGLPRFWHLGVPPSPCVVLRLFPPCSWAAVPGHWAGASPRFCPLKLIDFCADFYSTNVIIR